MERQADDYGMRMSRVDGRPRERHLTNCRSSNLSDPDPALWSSFWFYDHPTLKKRMEFAQHLETVS